MIPSTFNIFQHFYRFSNVFFCSDICIRLLRITSPSSITSTVREGETDFSHDIPDASSTQIFTIRCSQHDADNIDVMVRDAIFVEIQFRCDWRKDDNLHNHTFHQFNDFFNDPKERTAVKLSKKAYDP